MMKSMIAENGVTFKDLEKNIYTWVCGMGRRFTSEFLERYDRMLMEERDKSRYRNKGFRKTTIKTVYGELQQELDSIDNQISNMKKQLSSIVREYKFDSVQAFHREFNVAKKEYLDYQAARAEWKKIYGEKTAEPMSIRDRLKLTFIVYMTMAKAKVMAGQTEHLCKLYA